MGESRTKNVLHSTVAGIMVKCITMILNFILKTIFIKMLGIQYTGVAGLFTDILTILSFAELGIGTAITYALYKPVAEQDERQIAKLMSFYKSAYRMVATVVLIGGMLLFPFLDVLVKDVPDIREDIRIIYLLYLFNTTCSYLLIYKSSILIAKQKKYVISRIEGTMTVTRMLTECVMLLIFRQFLLYLVMDIFFTILQNYLIGKKASGEYSENQLYKSERLSKSEKKIIFADIGALAMYQISGAVLTGTDSIVISALLGTSLVGYLSYYKMIMNQITAFMQQFFTAANASVGNMAVQENGERQHELFCGLNFAVFWMTSVCSICLYILLNPFVEIWLGKDYVLGKEIVLVLVLDFYVTNMIRTVALFRTSNGLFIQGKYRPVIMAVLNVVLSVVLAYSWGLFGVLAATVFSRVLTQVWYDPWLTYREVFHVHTSQYFCKYVGFFLTTVLSALIVEVLIKHLMIQNGWIDLLVKMFICLIVSNGLIILIWHQTKDYQECMERIKNIFYLIKGGGRKNGR